MHQVNRVKVDRLVDQLKWILLDMRVVADILHGVLHSPANAKARRHSHPAWQQRSHSLQSFSHPTPLGYSQ